MLSKLKNEVVNEDASKESMHVKKKKRGRGSKVNKSVYNGL